MLKYGVNKISRLAVSSLVLLSLLVLTAVANASDNEPKKILALQQARNGDATANGATGKSPTGKPPASASAKPAPNTAAKGDSVNSSGTPAKSGGDRSATESLSNESESSILEFAKREQLQLFELLQYLKQKRPASYQQALKETGRNKQRLESLKDKDAELYEIESQLWRTRSKLSFLAAQMSVQDDAELDKQLETLVRDLETQEVARLTLMRDRTAKQLEKWESQLQDRKAEFSTSVDKNVESWKNRIKKQRSSPKKPS